MSEWIKRPVEEDVAALEKAHAGAFERDMTPEEMNAILRIQKGVREAMRAKRSRSDQPSSKSRRR